MEYSISLLVYVSAFLVSIIFSAIYQEISKKREYKELRFFKKIFWYLLIISPPVIISSLRYGVGTDYFNYVKIYNEINYFPANVVWLNYGNEPLFIILNKLSLVLFNDSWGVFFLSSLIIHLFIVSGLNYFKRYLSLPLALFLYYMLLFNFGLNGIRSAIAVSIVFFSIRYVYEKKFLLFLFWIIVATLIHNTAIVCLIFYLLAQKRNIDFSKTKQFLFYVSIILTPVLLLISLRVLINFPLFNGYARYVLGYDLTLSFGFLLSILPIILPILLYKKQIINQNKAFKPLINLVLLNIPFQYIGYYVEWGGRLALFTNSLYLILIPFVIRSIRRKEDKIIVCIYYIAYFLYSYISHFVIGNSSEGFPYKSYLWD